MMSAHQDTLWYSSITIGYSDSEDRIWIRLTGSAGESMLWLTRRMLTGLLRSAFDLMVGRASRGELMATHQQIIAARVDAPRAEAPPRAAATVASRQLGLVNAIDISVDGARVALTFKGAGGVAGFACDRGQAHELLQAFWDRQSTSEWGLAAPWEWSAAEGIDQSLAEVKGSTTA